MHEEEGKAGEGEKVREGVKKKVVLGIAHDVRALIHNSKVMLKLTDALVSALIPDEIREVMRRLEREFLKDTQKRVREVFAEELMKEVQKLKDWDEGQKLGLTAISILLLTLRIGTAISLCSANALDDALLHIVHYYEEMRREAERKHAELQNLFHHAIELVKLVTREKKEREALYV